LNNNFFPPINKSTNQQTRDTGFHMFRNTSQILRKVVTPSKLTTTTKRFAGNHPPAEHPYFDEFSPIYNRWAYTRITPNSTYGDKFPHPMNYQGHVPVTPTQFSGPNYDGAFLYEARPVNAPLLYFVSSVTLSLATMWVTAYLTQKLLLARDGINIKWDRFNPLMKQSIRLQGMAPILAYYGPSPREYKTIYDTEEFQSKLQAFLEKRNAQ
jgi:hypothetical protein